MLGLITPETLALVLLVFYLGLVVLFLVGWWKIVSKAGYSGAWALIGLVPLANVVMFFVFAFSDWPVHQQLRQGPGVPNYGGTTIPPRPY